MKQLVSFCRAEAAQAIVEFVLVLTVLLVILYGIIDVVHMGIIKHVLDSASREGVRVAATIPQLMTDNDVVLSRVNRVLSESRILRRTTVHLVDGMPEIVIGDGKSYADYGDMITVHVAVRYDSVFAVFRSNRTFTITGEAVGQYAIA